jgi:hypothetical protein
MTKHIGHFLNQDKMYIVKPKHDDDDIQDYVRPWVGLTIEEREQIQQECFGKVPHHVAFAHAIEAKLKEKNT